MRNVWLWVSAAALAFFTVLWFVNPAPAHEAPAGWNYPYECCGHGDCAPVEYTKTVDGEDIGNTKIHSGISLRPDKYKSIRPSPDNAIHVCATPDKAMGKGGRTYYCVFYPAGT